MGVIRLQKGTKVPFKCDLALSFGKLNKDSFKLVDERLKVIIGHTSRLINQLGNHSWDSLVRCMMQNTVLEPMDGTSINRSDEIRKGGTNAFKVDGSPDSAIVREVHSWFVRLIQDSDILEETEIDIVSLGRMVGQTGARIDSFESFFAGHSHDEQTVMDIGVLRYPDIEHPFFKLYKIRLRAWRDCHRVLFIQDDHSGISGEFHSIQFKPRDRAIAQLSRDAIGMAVKEAESLFD